MPADSFKDFTTMEWLFATKTKEENTSKDFNDLVRRNLEEKSRIGGLTGLKALNAKQLGYLFVSD